MLKYIFILFFTCFTSLAKAKIPMDSSAVAKKMVGFVACGDIPLADLAKRFGPYTKVGASFHRKSASNWLIGAKFSYMLGTQIKEPQFLNNLATQAGGTITAGGALNILRLYQQGYYAGIEVGKIIPKWQVNANSGPIVLANMGFVQHKIKIYDRDNQFPQLKGDYIKGYDRLTNGLYAETVLGYAYFGTKRNINGLLALSVNIASTQGRREWWFDTQTTGLDKRIDASAGLVFIWWIPFQQKKVEDIYY
jgi:hypothetical protein